MVDKSPGMLEEAKDKWRRVQAGRNESLLVAVANLFYSTPKAPLVAEFVEADAAELVTKFGEDSFDTVVDSFGLCSFQDPVQVLMGLRKLCKPDGVILLLEHGVGRYTWMKDYQEKALVRHVTTWGCYFNRDIEDIVQKAGLKIESIKRHHFGTTYCVVASPNK